MGSVQDIGSTNEFSTPSLSNPEHELLIAILDRAVLDFYSTRANLKEPAAEWLFENVDELSLFSFDWVCEQLNLEPEAVRKRIAELKLSSSFAQSHRWLRRKVQSGTRTNEVNDDDTRPKAA